MGLVKFRELNIIGNDVYLLEIIDDKIVINDNYEGIIILDRFFNIIKTIKIFDDLMIWDCYKNFSNEALLLYSYENSCFIHIDIQSWQFSIIRIEEDYEISFSPLCWWKSRDEIILITYKNELFKICLVEKLLIKVSRKYLKDRFPQFYQIWLDYKDVPVIHFFPQDNVLLVQDRSERELIIYNYINTTEERVSYILEDTHDFYYKKGSVLVIHEKQVDFITPHREKFKIPTKDPWVSLRAKFIESESVCFVVLFSNEACPKNEKLISYCLEKD